jgi:hypothetical protein
MPMLFFIKMDENLKTAIKRVCFRPRIRPQAHFFTCVRALKWE